MQKEWTDVLHLAAVVRILKGLDPLTLRLFGMTSKANFGRVRQIVDHRCRGQKPVYSICTLLDTYANVTLLEWADPIWSSRDGLFGETTRALENRNFESAAWLIEKKAYRRKGLWKFIVARDYEAMDWCYAHGFKIHERYLKWAQEDPSDQRLLDWFKGKEIKKEPVGRLRYYPDTKCMCSECSILDYI